MRISALALALVPTLSLAATEKTLPNNQFDIATTFGSLLFVIALIIFLAWMLKRMRVPSLGNQKGLSVVCQLALGTKERVAVIQAGEEQFLVGMTAQNINLIAKLTTPITQEASTAAPFAQQLAQLLTKHDKK